MATISRGYTFGATEQVTASKLHNLVDNATISGIVDSEIYSAAGIADTKLHQITTAGKVSGTALTGLADIDSGAGVIPAANLAIPVKASGAEIDTGTDDAKFATPKAIADSSLLSESPLVDFTTTADPQGWASFTALKYAKYLLVGKLVFVWFIFDGTSNATTVSFTLPFSIANGHEVDFALGSTYDNSSYVANGVGAIASGNTVNLFKSANAAWTNSGSKLVAGQFVYVKA